MSDQMGGPSGIGGWLAFFIVVLTLISPGLSIANELRWQPYFIDFPPIAPGLSVEAASWIVTTTSIFGTWFFAYRLVFVRRWTTVRMVIAGVWIIAVLGLVLRAAIISLSLGSDMAAILTASGFGQLRPFAFCTVWTVYLIQSDRVSDTYPRDDTESLATVFE